MNLFHPIAVNKGGKIDFANKEKFMRDVRQYEGKRCCLTIKPYGEVKTLNQLAYLWGVAYKHISEWSGETPNSIDEHLRAEYGPVKVIGGGKLMPEKKVVPKRLSEYSKKEMSKYIDQTIAWASERGVIIPEPKEVEG